MIYGLRLPLACSREISLVQFGLSASREAFSIGIGMHTANGITHTVQHHLPRETPNPPCCFLLFVFPSVSGILCAFQLFFSSCSLQHGTSETCIWVMIPGVCKQGGFQATGGLEDWLIFFFFFPSYLDLGYLWWISFSVVCFVLCLYVGSGTLVESPLIICNSCSGSSDKHGYLDGWMEEGCYREEQQMACSGEIALLIRAFSGFLCQLLWRSRAGFQGLQSL